MDLREGVAAYSSATVEKDIREFFRTERKRLGLNQADVAHDGGVEQSTISKIESERTYQPSVVIFLRAIRGLGMTPAVFFAKFESARRTTDRSGQSEKTIVPLQSQGVSGNTALSDREAHIHEQRRPVHTTDSAAAMREMQSQITALQHELATLVADREADRRRRERVSTPRDRKPLRARNSGKAR